MRAMLRLVVWQIVAVVMLGGTATGLRAEEPVGWKAGTGRVLITPQEPMWMAGYGARDRPSEGKLTELWAKALVLEDAQGQLAVLVTLDLIGTDRGLMQSICGRLAERHHLRREQIALCASHTHTGPALARNLAPLHYLVVDSQQRQRIEQYTTQVEERVLEAVEQALARRSPAELFWGSGTASFAVNRRNNRPESQVPQLRAEGRLEGPVDHDVPVLAVREPGGTLRAVVFGYACHATVLSFYQWSGDYPGFAQLELEQALPGCQAMFWAGCGGDQNPLPRRTVELARDYGRQLAQAVQAVLSKPLPELRPQLRAAYREIDLPLDQLPTREQIAVDTQSTDRFVAARAQLLLEQLERDDQLPGSYPYPVQTWRLGDQVQLVLLGGEVVVDYALRLKAELQGQRTWVAAYTNDVMAYIASRRVLAEGGYEGASAMIYYGLPTSWAPESEELIVREVHRQLEP